MAPLLRVLRYFAPYRKLAFFTLGCAILSTLTAMAPPYLVKSVVDQAMAQGSSRLLWTYVGGIALAYGLRDVFNMLRIRLNNTLEQRVILDMRSDVFSKMQQLSMGFYANRATGELMSRVVDDVNHVERVLLDGTEQLIVAALTLVGVTGILFYINPVLALVALIPIPILAAGAAWYTRRMRTVYRQVRERAGAMNASLHDALTGLLQIKLFNREKDVEAQFYEHADAYRKKQLKAMFTWATFSPSMNFVSSLGSLLVIAVGGTAVIRGTASVGDLFAFIFYLNLFYEPVNRLQSLNNLWQDALAASERVFEIMDTEPEIKQRPGARRLPRPVRGEVRFENVSFAYDASGREVLHDINLVVQPGERLALVGPTGAGKTTIVSLIPRLYEVTSGRVLVDGIDVRDLQLADLRSQVAVVSQEPFLFNGTVEENIRFGRFDATDEEVRRAATLANAHEFIERLPRGYQSVVGERGVKLSVGQKQRISIARAILKDAPILILDEATSAVDTVTELQIQEALERLMQNRTTFVIAHRLSTIRSADRIASVVDGRIVELGSHTDLVGRGGLYARLCEHQVRGLEGLLAAQDGEVVSLEAEAGREVPAPR